ncbi:hypothetical protein BDV93DRAFT_408130, partial [Ceratobasidium sp. AG-I]
LTELIINGKVYEAPVPGGASTASPIRHISTASPWKDANGLGIVCGPNATSAALVAPVTAGSTIELARARPSTNWIRGPWTHNIGPMLTYIAKVVPAGQTADNFDATQADFFKIAQVGKQGEVWVQETLVGGAMYNITIPNELEDGDYILRDEIITLQYGDKKGGAEFYPNCIQLRVERGAETTATPIVRFPGAYSADDEGIYTPNIFDPTFVYTFPGGSIATISSPS